MTRSTRKRARRSRRGTDCWSPLSKFRSFTRCASELQHSATSALSPVANGHKQRRYFSQKWIYRLPDDLAEAIRAETRPSSATVALAALNTAEVLMLASTPVQPRGLHQRATPTTPSRAILALCFQTRRRFYFLDPASRTKVATAGGRSERVWLESARAALLPTSARATTERLPQPRL